MKFKDEVRIKIRSGNGGPGCASFRREKYVPRGGPDGGNGGRGGNVIFRVNERLNTLIDLRPNKLYKARNGQPGEGDHCSGADGEDLVLEVPRGTVVIESGNLLADLSDQDEAMILEGGRGGKGNAFFKSSINQTPTHFQPGESGHEIEVTIELKLIAEVGLLGFPNVGKSTFISMVSAAKPKVADYPFTTLVPNLGVVKLDLGASFVIADIPGIIEGAHQGVGLGIQFLKHIERTKVFLHILDPVSGRDPLDDYRKIRHELEAYDREKALPEPLAGRPEFVVINKSDAVDDLQMQELKLRFSQEADIPIRSMSAATQEGTREIVEELAKKVLDEEFQ